MHVLFWEYTVMSGRYHKNIYVANQDFWPMGHDYKNQQMKSCNKIQYFVKLIKHYNVTKLYRISAFFFTLGLNTWYGAHKDHIHIFSKHYSNLTVTLSWAAAVQSPATGIVPRRQLPTGQLIFKLCVREALSIRVTRKSFQKIYFNKIKKTLHFPLKFSFLGKLKY